MEKLKKITKLNINYYLITKNKFKEQYFLLPYLATQIHTSLSINIQEHFIQHFLRFINKTTNNITEYNKYYFNSKRTLWN